MERALRGWLIGLMLMIVAIASVPTAWFLVGPLVIIGGPGSPESQWIWSMATLASVAIGIIGPIVGLVWMWRIHRAHLDGDPKHWRYRDFD